MDNNPITVLVIEDDPGDVDFLRELLAEVMNPVFNFVHTDRLSTGLARLAEGGIDVVLLDLSLPDSHGLETFAKAYKSAQAVPIVVVTGWDDETIGTKAVQAGAQDYLIKRRMQSHMLVSAIQYAIERHRLRMELGKRTQALQASEARLRHIIQQNADGIIIVDQQRMIRFVNPAAEAIFRRRADVLLGRPFAFSLNTEETAEIDISRKDGEATIAEMRVVEIEWEGERAYLTSLRDITERKRAEEALRQTQKLESLGVLAGGIAHDFNNLLAAILGNVELALYQLSADTPLRSLLQKIESAATRAAELTRQLLAYAGKGKITVESLNLSTLVQEMGQLLETAISKKAILQYNLAPHLPLIRADATQVRQVVMNLITNASDALGDTSGTITVSTGVIAVDHLYLATTVMTEEKLPEGRYVYVEVADTGCGMDAETQAKIFDPFFSTKSLGRGLGLAAVLGIVRAHRGTIRVQSAPGRGTTFQVVFPMAKSSDETPRPDIAKHIQPRGGIGTILVVDDEEEVRTTVKMALEEFGFTVLTATDGQEGVTVFRAHAPQIRVVLLDLMMPRMDGVEAFHEMLSMRPHACVILTSGYTEQEVSKRLLGNKPAGFLQKPYRLAELFQKIQTALAVL